MNKQKTTARLLLASGSPRREELLRCLGVDFQVMPSGVDEQVDSGLTPEQVVISLAEAKARDVADALVRDHDIASPARDTTTGGNAAERAAVLVLGADTIVVLDGDILGKPASPEDACSMLSRLAGRRHQVFTGVALVSLPAGTVDAAYEVSGVYFRDMDPVEIRAYVDTAEPLDKAGAYALQGTGSAFVSRIEGCFTNVIGLPVPMVVKLLRSAGVSVLGLP